MAKQAVAVEAKPGVVQQVTDFVQEVRHEMDKVTWPSLEDIKVSTRVCLYMIMGMIVVVFLFDQFFSKVIFGLLKLAS